MKKWSLRLLKLAYTGLVLCLPIYALADYTATQGAGTIFRAFDATHNGTSLCAAATTQCQAVGLINSAGAEIGTSGAPVRVDPTGTTPQPVTLTSTTITGNVASTVAAGSNVTEGNTTDAACAGDNTSGCTIESRLIRIAQNLTTVDTDVKASIPAGTNSIGSVNLAANVTATACSATVVTGGTAVNAFTAQTTLHGFTIANIDTAEVMWISFTTTAAASGTDSYPLAPATATTFAGLSSFTAPSGFGLNHALSVVAATNGHKFSCTWW